MTKWRSETIWVVLCIVNYEDTNVVAAFRNKRHAEKEAETRTAEGRAYHFVEQTSLYAEAGL